MVWPTQDHFFKGGPDKDGPGFKCLIIFDGGFFLSSLCQSIIVRHFIFYSTWKSNDLKINASLLRKETQSYSIKLSPTIQSPNCQMSYLFRY